MLIPYGVEIENEPTRRLLLPRIKEELRRIAQKYKLRCKGSDLRWRHVLLEQREKPTENADFFLSDFGSLVELDENDDIEQVVERQMETLREEMGNEMSSCTPVLRRSKRGMEMTESMKQGEASKLRRIG